MRKGAAAAPLFRRLRVPHSAQRPSLPQRASQATDELLQRLHTRGGQGVDAAGRSVAQAAERVQDAIGRAVLRSRIEAADAAQALQAGLQRTDDGLMRMHTPSVGGVTPFYQWAGKHPSEAWKPSFLPSVVFGAGTPRGRLLYGGLLSAAGAGTLTSAAQQAAGVPEDVLVSLGVPAEHAAEQAGQFVLDAMDLSNPVNRQTWAYAGQTALQPMANALDRSSHQVLQWAKLPHHLYQAAAASPFVKGKGESLRELALAALRNPQHVPDSALGKMFIRLGDKAVKAAPDYIARSLRQARNSSAVAVGTLKQRAKEFTEMLRQSYGPQLEMLRQQHAVPGGVSGHQEQQDTPGRLDAEP